MEDSTQVHTKLMARAKQEFVLASVQALLQKMTTKCFKKCIDRPGITLDAAEQKCISMCMDRFMDSWTLVSQTFSNRVHKESEDLKPKPAQHEQQQDIA
ncbi:mitochondrial import inner membrane translocase subunit Tim13-like [Scaptodrosophila lebanonensis]|uniref:Mitochondrial import inner membrane translocase subunit n=1 Tax=Drosophila lebanonensis TaxID=7225 RepID=A0A6J2TW29_DROLE|nr:mitochondrial import inner membrane translocase subunit Tim13-like [Scaptodrosophila lebanonensis]